MKRISLHVPRLTEMEYRQNLLAQPETMAYNRGRAIDAEGYDPATGCIQFPRADWRYWRQIWLLNEPDFFSAYIRDNDRQCFVGEVCYFYDGETQAHIAGILIEARHRGKGYCAEGLRALADQAFRRRRWPCCAAISLKTPHPRLRDTGALDSIPSAAAMGCA